MFLSSRPSLSTSQTTIYKKGTSVKSITAGVAARRVGTVVLPQRILSGQCLTTAPVRYLEDQQSDCTFSLTRDLCSSDSIFSGYFYLQPSSNLRAFAVQGSPTDDTAAETNVNYFCTSDFSGYVKNTSGTIPNVTTSTFFNFALPSDTTCLDVCGNYICEEGVITDTTEPTRGTRCPFDNGSTLPPVPNINGNTCENAVLDVKYEFQWKGTRIVKVDATVILGNVPLSSEVTQRYEAKFNHQYVANGTVASDNYRNVTTTYDRSTGASSHNTV